jgi:hypothetical protein
LLCFSAAAANAQAAPVRYRHLCAVRRCQVLAVTTRAEVLRARQRRDSEEPYKSSFARLRGSERLVPLGDREIGPTVGVELRAVTLAGVNVGYALATEGEQPPDLWYVYRLNVRTGKRERFAAGPHGEVEYPRTGGGVEDIAGLVDGTLAWTVGGTPSAPAAREVMEIAGNSSQPTTVTEDPTLEPSSLALSPGYLYWSASSGPHAQRLP